jgi:transglutaminase-like putative cysteine protease
MACFTRKSLSQIERTSQNLRTYGKIADKVLEKSESILEVLDLPPSFRERSQKLINFLREKTDTANSLVHHKALSSFLSMVSPASAEIFGQKFDNYTYIFTDDCDQPFQINQEIVDTSKKITAGQISDNDKAMAIFDWFIKNIKYGRQKIRMGKKKYRHAAEVYNDREGVCGEMAVLYVAMARSVGLQANYVSVDIDYKGEKVYHACAAFKFKGKYILVDPAYYSFDIKHVDYKVMTDQEAVPHFKAMRGY